MWMRVPRSSIGAEKMSGSEPVYQEPPTAYWRAPSSYDARLREDFLASLKSSSTTLGAVPQPMQIDVLRRLHWYFTVDGSERQRRLWG